MNAIEREELMHSMAHLERAMQQPERGQTTFDSLRNDIAKIADTVWQILDHLEIRGATK